MPLEEQLRALTEFVGTCPTIHRSPAVHNGWVDEAPRILLAGVDTLHFSFPLEVSEEIFNDLIGEQSQARLAQQERNAAYCSE